MNYRSDIDGLRSIAVFLVVLHHAGFEFLPGGYVGVDVFFVISGYLITAIVYKKAVVGQFSFANFYVRRIRRLMPALFTVLLVTSFFSLLYLVPSDLVRYGKSLLYVFFYSGNFFFWTEYGGYFAGNTQEAPLLHTWSLAVEEQYYLVWPIYILIGLKLFSTKTFGVLTILLFIFSIFFSEWVTRNTIGAAYYLLPTRFFELLLGSVLAIYWDRIPDFGRLFNNVMSITGISLIVGSSVYLSATSLFPGINAMYPTVGSALLILTNKGSSGIVNRVLSLKPFVFFGLISYSLYLWHWPIFVFIRYTAIELTLIVQLSCIGLSILLSYLSWRFVELPFRCRSSDSLWSVLKNLILKPGMAVGLVCLIVLIGRGLPFRYPNEILIMDDALNLRSHTERLECHSPSRYYDKPPFEDCLLGNIENRNNVAGLLIGDSHANHLAGFVETLAIDANHLVQDYTMDQCPPIFGLEWGRSSSIAEKCLERNFISKSYIEKNKFKYVILAASWPYIGSSRAYLGGITIGNQEERADILETLIRETVEFLTAQNIVPILIDDITSVVGVDPKCPIKRELFDQSLSCFTSETNNVFMEQLFSDLESEFPYLIRINLNEIICSEGQCALDRSGIPLYMDSDHLNMAGSRYLGEQYLLNHDNPFLKTTQSSNNLRN